MKSRTNFSDFELIFLLQELMQNNYLKITKIQYTVYTGSLQLATGCLSIVQSYDRPPKLLTTRFQNSDGFPPLCSATGSYFEAFAASQGHIITIYDGLAENSSLFPVYSKPGP